MRGLAWPARKLISLGASYIAWGAYDPTALFYKRLYRYAPRVWLIHAITNHAYLFFLIVIGTIFERCQLRSRVCQISYLKLPGVLHFTRKKEDWYGLLTIHKYYCNNSCIKTTALRFCWARVYSLRAPNP